LPPLPQYKEVIKPLDFHEKPVLKLIVCNPNNQHHNKSDYRLHDSHLSSKEAGKTVPHFNYGKPPQTKRRTTLQ